MMLAVFGAVLLVLGLFAGAALVLAPLGVVAWSTGPVLWLLFPVFSVAGLIGAVGAARSGDAAPRATAGSRP